MTSLNVTSESVNLIEFKIIPAANYYCKYISIYILKLALNTNIDSSYNTSGENILRGIYTLGLILILIFWQLLKM